MALYRATIKRSGTTNGVHLEKGMSVEVVSKYTGNPLSTNSGLEVVEAFKRTYGVDIKKANMVSSAYIEMVKLQ